MTDVIHSGTNRRHPVAVECNCWASHKQTGTGGWLGLCQYRVCPLIYLLRWWNLIITQWPWPVRISHILRRCGHGSHHGCMVRYCMGIPIIVWLTNKKYLTFRICTRRGQCCSGWPTALHSTSRRPGTFTLRHLRCMLLKLLRSTSLSEILLQAHLVLDIHYGFGTHFYSKVLYSRPPCVSGPSETIQLDLCRGWKRGALDLCLISRIA